MAVAPTQGVPLERALLSLRELRDERGARSVKSALSLIGGVAAVSVYLRTREASVRFDPRKVATWQLRKAVQAVGFDSVVERRVAKPV